MKHALIDTNVVLDYVLEREPFIEAASQVMDAQHAGRFTGYVCAITPLNIFYIVKRFRGKVDARRFVNSILQRFEICPVDKDILLRAMQLEIEDYEDAVQVTSALAVNIEVIITRDLDGYRNSPIRTVSPAGFIKELA